jgi:hypothetical protein
MAGNAKGQEERDLRCAKKAVFQMKEMRCLMKSINACSGEML